MQTHTETYDFGDCPSCYAPLAPEPDDRFDTGYAVTCTNRDCIECDACWPMPLRDLRRWKPEAVKPT